MDLSEAAAAVIGRLGPGTTAELVWVNALAGRTYRLTQGAETRYLKLSPTRAGDGNDVRQEARRLRWVGSRVRVPSVLATDSNDEVSWMVTQALPGTPASDRRWRADPTRTAQLLGQAVREFHDTLSSAVGNCPWSGRIADRLARCPESVAAQEMAADAPAEVDLVVAHGDLCAPNILLTDDGSPAGFVDLGELGVADRAADLGCHVWSLGYNELGAVVEEFLAAYEHPVDRAAVQWYRDFYTVA